MRREVKMALAKTSKHPAAMAGKTAPVAGLATRPAGAFTMGGAMLVLVYSANGPRYIVARAIKKNCHHCGERWWRIESYPGGFPPGYEIPAQWAGGLLVREWVSRSGAHFVWATERLEPAYLAGSRARGFFATGLFHDGPLAGYRRADEPFPPEPEVPGWEIVARYCLARPGHHLRAIWRAYDSRLEEEAARHQLAAEIEEESTTCRRCAEQQAAETPEEGAAE
jgi:hypothetical protein